MLYNYRPRGGQEGYAPTREEMRQASRCLFPDAKPIPECNGVWVEDENGKEWVEFKTPLPGGTEPPIDLAIPVPYGPPTPCETHQESVYWERDDGGHGWACAGCGAVVQWG